MAPLVTPIESFRSPTVTVVASNNLPLFLLSFPLGLLVLRSPGSVDTEVPASASSRLRLHGLSLLRDRVLRSGDVGAVPDDSCNNRVSYSSQSSSDTRSMASWWANARAKACSRSFGGMTGVNLCTRLAWAKYV